MTDSRPLQPVPSRATPPDPNAASPTARSPRTDAPLARELPAWDLLPSDLLLVRRRQVMP